MTAFAVLSICVVGCSSEETGGSSSQSGAGTGGEGGSPSTSSSSGGGTNSTTTTSNSTVGSGGAGTGGAGNGGTGGSPACGDDPAAPEEELADTTDPEAGVFTMDEALVDLPEGPGPLRAIITTELGVVTCEFFPEKAPIAVANFVGLARGRRAWKDPVSKKWVKRRFYDGLTFHRVIDNFVAQGGDPLGTGYGGPGYKFDDEITDLQHEPGTLAYANAGPDANGSQFYITEVALPSLDGGYTIFGSCSPIETIKEITAVRTDQNDKPITPIHTQTVVITRCAP